MARGGARPGSGPAPQLDALRRDRPSDGPWRILPREGRQGDPPPFPLARPTNREKAIWIDEWRRPQALVWEEEGLAVQVALYVRVLVRAERPKAKATEARLAKELMNSLGISLEARLKHRWLFEGEAPAIEEAAARRPTGTDGTSVKDRFKVLTGGG